MNAAIRAAERDAERRRKHNARLQMISQASEAVSEWQECVRELVTVHTNPADDIDWTSIARKAPPAEPERSSDHEVSARDKLESFRPRPWDFLFGGSARRLKKLTDALPLAVQTDEDEYLRANNEFKQEFSEWRADVDLAQRLLAGEAIAKRDVLAEFQSLSDVGLIGKRIAFNIAEDAIHAVAHVHDSAIVPRVRRKQLQSGRLSETRMPDGEFNELYQDYVCSVALRIAGDLFGLLPIEEAYVTCMPELLNSQNGHIEATPVLSVRFVRQTFVRLNLRQIDPSDAIANFVHHMEFKRSRGFAPIAPLRPIADDAP